MRTILAVCACVLLGACHEVTAGQCNGNPPSTGVTADRQVSDCTKLIDEGSLENDARADAYFDRGNAYRFKGDYPKAVADYDQALELRPDDPKILLNRGIANRFAGDPAKALLDFNRLIQLNPKSAEAYFNRGSARDQSGRPMDALRDYDKAIELKPDYADAYINRGAMKDAAEDYPGAIADYDRAIALDPKNALPHANKGVAYLNSGHVTEAIRALDASIALKPSAYAYIARGHAHSARNELELAIADYSAAIRLSPDSAEALNDRSIVKGRMGDRKGAQEDRAAALKLDPTI
jgi:tetratricopeptide (TPR) repeat protein